MPPLLTSDRKELLLNLYVKQAHVSYLEKELEKSFDYLEQNLNAGTIDICVGHMKDICHVSIDFLVKFKPVLNPHIPLYLIWMLN